ncbi:hypothetical protein I3843_04G007700 [Carya illinoinensis]|uniref:Uncharacterized protein n=1 Tax=Carya illinoinensis TaxID=32201 RepID=A0A922F4B2_CARIL|nr:hypothetical protein I3760_04G007800 [Carya illinoinensis]KAG2710066.1 hypothetical protein I3760_04G007800 [Carya illinoinensis]KAG6715708.1 hypothetical protein I3842_04G008200 [Carya illinoinensis]KAG7981667.1 hypothetical protein I3843_04G007700 [Carya illinoinensis]
MIECETRLPLISVRSITIYSSFYAANPENDGKRLQDIFLIMGFAIREHPLCRRVLLKKKLTVQWRWKFL